MSLPHVFGPLSSLVSLSYLDDNFDALQTQLDGSTGVLFTGTPNDTSALAKSNNSALMLSIINSFPEIADAVLDPSYSVGGKIVVPPGTYHFSSRLEIKRNIAIVAIGGTPQGNSFGPVRFVYPDGDHGIIIHSYVTSGTGKGADGTVIAGISVMPETYSATGVVPSAADYHGIWVRTKCRLLGVLSAGWPGNGIQVVATAGGGGDLEGNANNWEGDGLTVIQNGMNGLYMSGADANASSIKSVDSRANRRCGVRDSTFLGNTIDACHTSGNGSAAQVSFGGHDWYCLSDTLGAATTPGTDPTVWGDQGVGSHYPAWSNAGTYFIGSPYYSDNANARSTVYNGYSESGQPASVLKLPSQAYGGLHAAGLSTGSGFDPTVSTGPFWDCDLSGAILKQAWLCLAHGLNLAASKVTRSSDVETLDAYLESTWTPTDTGFTKVGALTITASYTRIGNRVMFEIQMQCATSLASVAATSYLSTPAGLTPAAKGVCSVAFDTTIASQGNGTVDTAGRIYTPVWGATANLVIVSGQYKVSTTA